GTRGALDRVRGTRGLAGPGAGNLGSYRPGMVAFRAFVGDAKPWRHTRRSRCRFPIVPVRPFHLAMGGAVVAARGRRLPAPDRFATSRNAGGTSAARALGNRHWFLH